MTDRELLELAAKAAGLEVWNGRWPQEYMFFTAPKNPDASGKVTGIEWNPLTDDGDALRLAVKLGIRFIHDFHNRVIVAGTEELHYDESKFGGECDPYAATRLAIVSAAAEIGKQMKDD